MARASFAPSLSDEQRLSWLQLARTERVGPVTFFHLINRFGSAEAALDALPEISTKAGGKSAPRAFSRAEAEQELTLADKQGIRHLAFGEARYPSLLREISDPPPFLLVKGDIDVETKPAIAIVGSRNASIAGQKMASILAKELGEEGCWVVSGLARGIDTAAHKSSLQTGTIAVLAGGHNTVYPTENKPLADEIIASGGAVISEMPPNFSPRGQDFPRRNRIVSGISQGVVIVEAASRSGSLITARLAGEQGRQVFAVPGSPLDPRSEGTNRLIRNGATLIRSANDIIEDLRPALSLDEQSPLFDQQPFRLETANADGFDFDKSDSDAMEIIMNSLSGAPVHVDDVVRACALKTATVVSCLCELEISGRVERLEGNMIRSAL